MSNSQQLYQLQQAELEFRKHRSEIASIEAQINNEDALNTAKSNIQTAESKLNSLTATQRDLELSATGLDDQVKEMDNKLYSGKTTNPKELLGFTADSKMLRKNREVIEDSLLQSMIEVDEALEIVNVSQIDLQDIQNHRVSDLEHLTQEKDRLLRELTNLEKLQQQLQKEVDPNSLSLYQLLKRTKGTSVARVEGGICRGCGLSVPSHELQKARSRPDLTRCSSCGRILYIS